MTVSRKLCNTCPTLLPLATLSRVYLLIIEINKMKLERIKQSRKGDFSKQDKWDEYFEWMGNVAIKFQETFNKY